MTMVAASQAQPLGDPLLHAAGVVRLDDGRQLTIRKIRISDADALVDFHEHLSEETVHNRFFGVHPHLARNEVLHFVDVDGHQRMAFVCLNGEHVVAVARYEGIEDVQDAEAAFVIADDYHHHGLGRELVRELAVHARNEGFKRLLAEVLNTNRSMLEVFAHVGMPARFINQPYGIIHVILSLPPEAPSANAVSRVVEPEQRTRLPRCDASFRAS